MKELLELLGLANDADETAITTAVRAHIARADAAANDLATRTAELATANGLLATANTALAAANDATATAARERDEARTQLAAANDAKATADAALCAANDRVTALRAGRVDDALALAITAGRVLPAEKDAKRTALLAAANDETLTTALGELSKADPKIKTSAVTTGLGKARTQLKQAANDEAETRKLKIRDAVAAELDGIRREFPAANDARRYDMATARARAKNPDLFA